MEKPSKEEYIRRMNLWLGALRSGQFQQGRRRLAAGTVNELAFCCLGVACVVASQTEPDLEVSVKYVPTKGAVTFDGWENVPPPTVLQWYGLVSYAGVYGDDPKSSLTYKNDSGATFEQIASIIEQHQVELFSWAREDA